MTLMSKVAKMTAMSKIPQRMLHLPRERSLPLPWFAGRGADGRLSFTILDGAKKIEAVERRLCWMCGKPLERVYAFVLGPIQTITRTVTEPPSHPGCADYASKVCPFLSNPARDRFDGVAASDAPANPGVFALWRTYSFELGDRGRFIVGEPIGISWRTRGRRATVAEIKAAQAMAAKLYAEASAAA